MIIKVAIAKVMFLGFVVIVSVGETDSRTPMEPADRGPFRFGGGRRSHEERIEAKHTSSLPSFGALRRDNTPTVACLIVLCSCSRES